MSKFAHSLCLCAKSNVLLIRFFDCEHKKWLGFELKMVLKIRLGFANIEFILFLTQNSNQFLNFSTFNIYSHDKKCEIMNEKESHKIKSITSYKNEEQKTHNDVLNIKLIMCLHYFLTFEFFALFHVY